MITAAALWSRFSLIQYMLLFLLVSFGLFKFTIILHI